MSALNIVIVALLAVALLLSILSDQFIRQRTITTGEVTALLSGSRSNKGRRTYRIVATFRDTAGAQHTYRSTVGASDPGYKVGDSIRIAYRPDNPEKCGVYSFGYRFGVAWVCTCVALFLLAISLGFRHGHRAMDAIYLRAAPELR